MGEVRRRRVRTSKETPQEVIIQKEETEAVSIKKEEIQDTESQNWVSREELRHWEGNLTTTTSKGINEIGSELADDRRSELIESNYWDETHNWGSDNESASEDYWHFLGRYE